MKSKNHLLIGIAIGVLLFIGGMPLCPILLIIISSVLIDIDHYFYYVIKYKKYNPLKMTECFRKHYDLSILTNMLPVLIFHNIETMILLIILSYIFPYIIYIFIGFIIHMILDWMVMPYMNYPCVIKLSLIWVIIENNRRKRGCPK